MSNNYTRIRNQTDVNDIIDVIKKGMHGRAGHIARFKDGQDDREDDLKQDGETSSATWVLGGQE